MNEQDRLSQTLKATRAVLRLIEEERDSLSLLRRCAEILVETTGYSHAAFLRYSEVGELVFVASAPGRGGDGDGSGVPECLHPDEMPACLRTAQDESGVTLVEGDHPGCAACPLRDFHAGRRRLIGRLEHAGQIHGFGIIVLSPEADVGEEERSLLAGLLGDIAFSVHSMELAREDGEQRRRAIFDGAPIGIFRTTSAGRVLSINPAMARMLEFDEIEGAMSWYSELGRTLYANPARREEFLQELKDSGSVENFEYEATTRTGRIVWLSMSARVVEDLGGGVFTIEGFTTDVTERKQAEALFDGFMENSPMIAYMLSAEGEYLWGNSKANTVCGAGLFGGADHGLSDEANSALEHLREQDRRVLRYGLSLQTPGLRLHQETGTHYVDVFKFPLTGADGQPIVGTLCIDATERTQQQRQIKHLEGQYQQAQRMESIGRLAGGVAHDFNNLLTVISNFSELALECLPAASPARGDLRQVLDAADRASLLTKQLLVFSRRQIVCPAPLNLNDVIQRFDVLLPRVIGEDLEVRTVLAPKLWQVEADPAGVEQVLMNLAVNARDAMPEGGVLTIETANVVLGEEDAAQHPDSEPGSYVMVAVSDSGNGIEPTIRQQVFEPFFTTKETGQGTGLGLSMVYGFVKQSGGNIWVYSEVGLGTTFKLYLPRIEDEVRVQEIDNEEASPSSGERILVVEDEAGVRDLAVRILEAEGYKVHAAGGPLEALRFFGEVDGAVDLVLTDIVMPNMSGTVMAQRMLEVRPELPVLYMSGYTDNAIAHHGVLDSGTRFIAKPFNRAGLLDAIRKAIWGSSSGFEETNSSHGTPLQLQEAVSGLPAALKTRMTRHAERGEAGNLRSLVEREVRPEHSELAEMLAALVEAYDYDRLLKLLSPDETSDS